MSRAFRRCWPLLVTLPHVALAEPTLVHVTEGQQATSPPATMERDAVERLRQSPAVSLSRMGGSGSDPVIRGQGQERVDVWLDGIQVEGACPNRMDPPTSRLSTATPQSLDIHTTPQTLRWGALVGGQVMAQTQPPAFDGDAWAARVFAGGHDNGNGREARASVAGGSEQHYLRGSAAWQKADDYEDGDGNEVRSGFEKREGRIDGYYGFDNGTFVSADLARFQERDVRYAGAGMDTPEADTDLGSIRFGRSLADGQWQATVWRAEATHIMDNFSLRPLTAPMKMLTDSEADTTGARWVYDHVSAGPWQWSTGVDYSRNDWLAERYTGANLDNLQSLMWPDVSRERWGWFAEAFRRLAQGPRLGGGVRYDRVDMDADRAGENLGMATPAMLYRNTYGVDNTHSVDDNVSGFLSSEWQLTASQSLTLTVSRSVRSPGATERYLAGWSMMPAMRWIGNPQLEAEKHHKAELAWETRQNQWQWQASAWLDRVDDYALRTRATDGSSIYRSISAKLYGAELSLTWRHGPWLWQSQLASVRGEDRDHNDPLPQIPPVTFQQQLAWSHQGHRLGLEWQVARRQTRVNTASGQDPGPTPGYGVLNLSGEHPLTGQLTLLWSLDNLLDKTWAPHVSRANTDPFNPEAVRVNEPGRTISAGLQATF
ncbi:TonB-dependent receptor [Marinobacteraceae bacterium S3BR75-40.1]